MIICMSRNIWNAAFDSHNYGGMVIIMITIIQPFVLDHITWLQFVRHFVGFIPTSCG